MPRDITFYAFAVISVAAVIISGANTGIGFYNASSLSGLGVLLQVPSVLMRWAAFVLGTLAVEGMVVLGLAKGLTYLSYELARKLRAGFLFTSTALGVIIMGALALQVATGKVPLSFTNSLIGLFTPLLAVTSAEVVIGDIYELTRQPRSVSSRGKKPMTISGDMIETIGGYWKAHLRADGTCSKTYADIRSDLNFALADELEAPIPLSTVKTSIHRYKKRHGL